MDVTVGNRPALSAGEVTDVVREHYRIEGRLSLLPAEWDQNLRIECGSRGTFVVKIANRGVGEALLEFQNAVFDRLNERWTSASCPRVVRSGSGRTICTVSDSRGNRFQMRLLTYLEGTPLSRIDRRGAPMLEQLGYALGELDRCLVDFRHPAMDRELRWDLRKAEWISRFTARITGPGRRGLVERLLLQYRARVRPLHDALPMSVIHNDANDENILLLREADGGWKLSGLLDFGDMVRTHTVNEPAIAIAYAVLGSDDPLEIAAHVVAGYHRARPLAEVEFEALFPLVCLRLCVSVTTSAIAASEDPGNRHRQITDRDAWEMLEKLDRIDWNDAESVFRQRCGLDSRTARPATAGQPAAAGQAATAERAGDTSQLATAKQPGDASRAGDAGRTGAGSLLERRRRSIAPSFSLAYREPIEIVRGRAQFLFDRAGRGYLDCVNNICHVGHCHPRVVAALAEQAALLNTNTRYLHPRLVEYAERLTATLPHPLRVCLFVNSGSEANELAVRIARTVTGREDVIVLEDAYHGNTGTLVDLSPYKCEGPGGRGLARWAHKASKPDAYRGIHRGTGEAIGRAYAGSVRDICERLTAERRPPALFMCESILGCGGQIVLPDGYLGEAFAHVRAAGGLCLVDEVQVGCGRVGSHMWAFETQNVVPDIVTLGKPLGNGHPLGAVVTTEAIAAAFANGMEFFSSFGGNPVSAAAGLAVLEVIEEERLRERAAQVGSYLAGRFREIAGHHPMIGDVRGLGMFLGVELVRSHNTLEPATRETAELIERLKADRILMSAEGPHHNVLKIKPPLPFDEIDADLLVGAVSRALTAISNEPPGHRT